MVIPALNLSLTTTATRPKQRDKDRIAEGQACTSCTLPLCAEASAACGGLASAWALSTDLFNASAALNGDGGAGGTLATSAGGGTMAGILVSKSIFCGHFCADRMRRISLSSEVSCSLIVAGYSRRRNGRVPVHEEQQCKERAPGIEKISNQEHGASPSEMCRATTSAATTLCSAINGSRQRDADACGPPVTRHTVLPTSSAISSAPDLSTAKPTGRPRA